MSVEFVEATNKFVVHGDEHDGLISLLMVVERKRDVSRVQLTDDRHDDVQSLLGGKHLVGESVFFHRKLVLGRRHLVEIVGLHQVSRNVLAVRSDARCVFVSLCVFSNVQFYVFAVFCAHDAQIHRDSVLEGILDGLGFCFPQKEVFARFDSSEYPLVGFEAGTVVGVVVHHVFVLLGFYVELFVEDVVISPAQRSSAIGIRILVISLDDLWRGIAFESEFFAHLERQATHVYHGIEL